MSQRKVTQYAEEFKRSSAKLVTPEKSCFKKLGNIF